MLRIAMEQTAEDIGCRPKDLECDQNVIVPYRMGTNARKYLRNSIPATFVSYGSNVVAAASEDIAGLIREYVSRFAWYQLFETPAMFWLNTRLAPAGYGVCFMADYFLPAAGTLPAVPCSWALRILGPADFENLYLPQWSNALCADRKHLDVLGIGAYDGDTLVGLAACSADCGTMWQIGVDVLPAYRRSGIAAALTGRLAHEILTRGKVPFYCCAWSNIPSSKTAIRSGFMPAWVEMTIKPITVIQEMNGHP